MDRSVIRGLLVASACFLIGMLSSGCDLPDRPPLSPADVRPAGRTEFRAEEVPEQEVLEAPGRLFDGGWETWDAYFVRGQHVGYSHVVAESAGNKSTRDVRYVLDNRLFVNQGRSRFLQRLIQTSTETEAGRLIGFESVLQVGPAVTRFEGTISDGDLQVETIRAGSRTIRAVPWQSTYRGLVALEQSLRQKPLENKGETRTLKILLPGQYELATARLRCSGNASVPLIDGALAELLEIDCEIQIGDKQPIHSTIWTNEEGGIIRTYSPGLQLVAYRTDETTATEFNGNRLEVAAIAMDGVIDRPSEATRVAYKVAPTAAARVSEKAVDIEPLPGQYVRRLEDGTLQVLVSRKPENVSKGFVASSLVPSDADLQVSRFVDFNTTLIRRFADAMVGTRQMTDREVAIELTHRQNQLISLKSESSGFVKASNVALDAMGDSTAQAVLLAALLRARKIPSRIAVGIKYADGQPNRMVYHVWTLAHVEGDWLHLDATDGTLAAADRLTLATTNLSGGNENDALTPFLDLIGHVEIKVIAVQH